MTSDKPSNVTDIARLITRDGDQLRMSSREVARLFGKRHADVLRAITDEMAALKRKDRTDFTERNFALSEFCDASGRSVPHYWLAEDGVYQVGMGFTGDDASLLRSLVIEAFRTLREQTQQSLASPQQLLLDMREASNRIEVKVEETNDNVVSLAKRYDEDQRHRRKAIPQNVKDMHVQCLHIMSNGLCPHCHRTRIVDDDGQLIPGAAEFDHRRDRSDCRAQSTWAICVPCHDSITHTRPSEMESPDRTEHRFIAYQDRLCAWRAQDERDFGQMKLGL